MNKNINVIKNTNIVYWGEATSAVWELKLPNKIHKEDTKFEVWYWENAMENNKAYTT